MSIQEVHLTDKTPKDNRWEKALFLLLLPISIAAGGWAVQSITTKKVLEKDYVALSISILNTDKKIDPKLKDWAVTIVNKYAPLPLPKGIQDDLRSGKETLSGEKATKVFNDGVLIVKDGNDGNVIISVNNIADCKAEYSWKHFTSDARQISGSGQLFEKYVEDINSGVKRDEGITTIRASTVNLKWSCGSNTFGWVYPSVYEMRFVSGISIDEFKL